MHKNGLLAALILAAIVTKEPGRAMTALMKIDPIRGMPVFE
jgi:hypothetical protein